MTEARAARTAAEEARARVAGAALVQGYVAELLPAVLAGLRDAGHLLRRVRRGVDDEAVPWLVREVAQEIESIITSRDVIAGTTLIKLIKHRSSFFDILKILKCFSTFSKQKMLIKKTYKKLK